MRRLRRLSSNRTARWEARACVLEGPDLVTAAIASGASIEAVYVEAAAARRESCAATIELATAERIPVVELADGAIARVADAVTPQPVLAVAALFDQPISAVDRDGVVLVCCDVRDPGNLGTAVRAADAAGAAGVVVAGESVDPFNPKALRATAGSCFHLPIAVVGRTDDALAALRAQGRTLIGAVARDGAPLFEAELAARAAVVVGGESAGLPESARTALDGLVTIEMAGHAESLNVGVAAALLCFEWRRRAHGAHAPVPPTI